LQFFLKDFDACCDEKLKTQEMARGKSHHFHQNKIWLG
jgi:hypothetical protein